MTLSPIFRSRDAVRLLTSERLWPLLEGPAQGQRAANDRVVSDLPNVIATEWIATDRRQSDGTVDIEFVQQYFFLILFHSVLDAIGANPAHTRICAELNFCIKGTITAADNLFDGQDKRLLPLEAREGSTFGSILDLLVFESLTNRLLERGIQSDDISRQQATSIRRELLSMMASVGALEGSEEAGIDVIPPPARMIEAVHRVRGGALFELAFVAPRVIALAPTAVLSVARRAISKLGTAFQIVDDITDFENDVKQRSHNLLVSQIVHGGSEDEKAAWASLHLEEGSDIVTLDFRNSARQVLDYAVLEAHDALTQLSQLGLAIDPKIAESIVKAIVGNDGVARLASL